MCQTCTAKDSARQIAGATLVTPKWVDRNTLQLSNLPALWQVLDGKIGQDLIDRAIAFWGYTRQFGDEAMQHNADALLATCGLGFLEPFNADRFRPQQDDPFADLKNNALNALVELAVFYGNRLPAVFWDSFAYLATRDQPETERSILQEAQHDLPHHYTIIDSCLHASGMVYKFLLHVNSVMFHHTGRVLDHNCDCSCSLVNLTTVEGSILFTPEQEKIIPMTQSLFTHLLCETVKLQSLFLPFALGLTPEAAEIMKLG